MKLGRLFLYLMSAVLSSPLFERRPVLYVVWLYMDVRHFVSIYFAVYLV